jgi:predicted permease
MSGFGFELRQAVRTLLRSPGFSAIAGMTLALGIAANAVLFAVTKNVVMEPLAYPDADRLVRLWSNLPESALTYFSVSALDYADWKERNQSFESMASFERQTDAVVRLGSGEPQRVLVARTTPALFDVLAIAPRAGRVFDEAEVRSGERVAVITDEFWRARFGARDDALGATLIVDGEPFMIAGIMPPSFTVPGNPAMVWTPLDLSGETDRRRRFLRVFARLHAHMTPDSGHAEMQRITRALAEEYPATNRNWTITMVTLNDFVVGPAFRRAVSVLLGVVALILLIASANVTNMMLARSVPRAAEAAACMAMGATRARVVRSRLIESALLGFCAGILGLLLATWGIDFLQSLEPSSVPRVSEIRVDAAIAVLVIALSLAAGVTLAIAPAAIGTNLQLARALRDGGRGLAGVRSTWRVRNVLLMAETALTLVLLIAAALLLKSFWQIRSVPLGFEPEGVLTAEVALPASRYDNDARVRSFFDDLIESTRALPGVHSASAVSRAPLGGPSSSNVFAVERQPISPGAAPPDADYRVILPDYFETMGIRIVAGRDFAPADHGTDDRVIVSESMARRYWGGEDAIGQRIRFGDLTDGPWRTIIGIVEDVRYQSLEALDVRPMIYLPNVDIANMAIVVRTGAEPATLASSLRQIVSRLDPELALGSTATATELVTSAFGERLFHMVLFGLFGGLALVLAAVGTYGVIASAVAQRTAEIGVRIALGADARRVLRTVVSQALTWAGSGILIGLFAGASLTRLLEQLLFQTTARDPLAFASTTLLLLAVTFFATWVPARRATRLDPAAALRG